MFDFDFKVMLIAVLITGVVLGAPLYNIILFLWKNITITFGG